MLKLRKEYLEEQKEIKKIEGKPKGLDAFIASNQIEKFKSKKEYKNLSDEQIYYINRWSWGAFLGGWMWLLGNRLYLWLIPIVIANAVFAYTRNASLHDPVYVLFIISLAAILSLPIYFGVKGRQLAWEEGWKNFDQFEKRQVDVSRIILVYYLIIILVILFVASKI